MSNPSDPTPGRPPSDSEEEQRRGIVLLAALQMFVERGFSAASMEALAKSPDVNKDDLYRLFDSKEELFREAIAFRCRQRLAGDRDDDNAAPTAYLTLFGHRAIQLVITPRSVALQRAVIAELDHHPELGGWMLEASLSTAAEVLAPKLHQWDLDGRMHIPEPMEAATEFIEAVTGSLNVHALMGTSPPPSRREIGKQLNAAIEIFLNRHA